MAPANIESTGRRISLRHYSGQLMAPEQPDRTERPAHAKLMLLRGLIEQDAQK